MNTKHRLCIITNKGKGLGFIELISKNVKALINFERNINVYQFEEEKERPSNVNKGKSDNINYSATLEEACSQCNFIFICCSNKFLSLIINGMKGHLLQDATILVHPKKCIIRKRQLTCITSTLSKELNVPCGSIVGGFKESEITSSTFIEASIGFENIANCEKWKPLLQTSNFRIKITGESIIQEIAMTLRGIIALCNGICSSLQVGQSTKGAFIRLGLQEILNFSRKVFPDREFTSETLLNSCSISCIIQKSYDSYSTQYAESFASNIANHTCKTKEKEGKQRVPKSMKTMRKIMKFIHFMNLTDSFPLFSNIFMIITSQLPPSYLMHFDNVDFSQISFQK